MPFTLNMTGTAQLDDSIITAFDQGFIVASFQANVMEQFAQKASIVGGSYQLPRYAQLTVDTTPLTEDTDPTSEAMADTKVVFTPAEYGKVVTRTLLASLQTGGKADLAAAQLVGVNAGRVRNKLACLALDASTNVRVVAAATEATLAVGNILSRAEIAIARNKLARLSVPMVGDQYVAIVHDDVLTDVMADTSTGGWTDVAKYAEPDKVLMNEVGNFGGFRWIRNNDATFADQSGAGFVDVYNNYFLGFNALGVAVSKEPTLSFTSTDKLGRFVNVGWVGVLQYKIVEQDAVYVIRSASSVGANLA
jgi:N4-gp56 family major capsid protein